NMKNLCQSTVQLPRDLGKRLPSGSRFAADQLTQWTHSHHRLSRFYVLAKSDGEHRPSVRPPNLNTGPMIIDPHVQLPTFPLLAVERSVTPLKPRVLKYLERNEKRRHRARPVFHGGAVPVVDGRRKR